MCVGSRQMACTSPTAVCCSACSSTFQGMSRRRMGMRDSRRAMHAHPVRPPELDARD